jgi:hypothetical protein
MNPEPLPLPKGFSREVQVDRLIIRRSWRAYDNMAAIALFVLVWNAVLFGWFFRTEIRWTALTMNEIFPLLFVGFGLFLAYSVIGTFANTTVLEITPDALQIKTGPIPWHREVRVTTGEIRSVFCRERGRFGNPSHQVLAVLVSGQEKSLIEGLIKPEQADFYAQEIRSWLKLPDDDLAPDA